MKIAVIGGAGVRTVNFINGILPRYKKLNIDKVTLYDINPEKLDIIAGLCKYVVDKAHEELIVEAVHTPEEAIIGADYVVTTIRVGDDHSRVVDERLCLRHGVIGQETTGAGGFFMAARAIKPLLEYARMTEKLAPDAWIFNFSNPSGLVTQALNSAGIKKVIGICDAPYSTTTRIADALNVPMDKVYTEFFGLNHLSWIRKLTVDGKEMLPDIIDNDEFLEKVQEFRAFDKDALKVTGFLPNEYLYYYYHREKALANLLAAKKTRGETIEELNIRMFEELKNFDLKNYNEDTLQTFLYYIYLREYSYMTIETGGKARPVTKGNLQVPSGMGYAGVMLDAIEALQHDKVANIVLSVKNNGAIAGFSDDDVVEISCNISKAGIVPVHIGEIPEHCSVLMHQIKQFEKLSAYAIIHDDDMKAVEALACHPLVSSYSLAKEIYEDYKSTLGE